MSLGAVTKQLDEGVSCKCLLLAMFLRLTVGLTSLESRPSLPLLSWVPAQLQSRWRLVWCRACSLPARPPEHT